MPNRILVAVPLALAMFACSPGDDTVTAPLGVPADAPEVSEAYLIKEAQYDWAKRWKYSMEPLTGRHIPVAYNNDHWSQKDQTVLLNRNQGWNAYRVTYTSTHYDPAHTDISYGHPHVIGDPLVNEGAKFQIVDNSQGESDVTHKISLTFTQEHSVESTFSHSYEFDFEASSETTVSGGFAGVSLEETLSVKFGTSFSSEESQTKSESTSTEQTIEDEVPVPAGIKVLISFSTKRQTELVPFSVNGVLGWGWKSLVPLSTERDPHTTYSDGGAIRTTTYPWEWTSFGKVGFRNNGNLGWYDRTKRQDGSSIVHWDSINDYADMWRGTHVDWPHMAGVAEQVEKIHDYRFVAGDLAWLQEPENRRIQMTGTQNRVADSSIEYTISDVTDGTCDESAISDAFSQSFTGTAADKLEELGCQHKPVSVHSRPTPTPPIHYHRSVIRLIFVERNGGSQ